MDVWSREFSCLQSVWYARDRMTAGSATGSGSGDPADVCDRDTPTGFQDEGFNLFRYGQSEIGRILGSRR